MMKSLMSSLLILMLYCQHEWIKCNGIVVGVAVEVAGGIVGCFVGGIMDTLTAPMYCDVVDHDEMVVQCIHLTI